MTKTWKQIVKVRINKGVFIYKEWKFKEKKKDSLIVRSFSLTFVLFKDQRRREWNNPLIHNEKS